MLRRTFEGFMKRTLFGTLILASSLVAASFWAGAPPAIASAELAQPETSVGSQSRLLRVAIPTEGKLGDLLRKNAQLSSGFEVISRRALPANLARATTFNKDAWSGTSADVVVLAENTGSQLKVRMYELSKGAKPVLSRGYPNGDPLKAANRFMNDVVEYYTGQEGVFGSRIAFVRTRRNPTTSKNVQTVQMNGEAPAAVTSNRSLNILPSIGPGGEVLFTSYAKRNPDLWMSSGGAARRVSRFPGLNLGGVMSPDGSTIAVALSKDGNSEIYAVGRDGSVKARLTKNAAIDGSPSYGPGGQIAFVSNRAGSPQIYRMSARGGGAARVTKQGKYNQSPDWNQGKGMANWIVYSGRDSSNRYAIFKVDVKSGKAKPLSSSPGRNLDPSWSPDGRLIAYSKGGGIYIANEDGNNNVQIIKGGSTPDWGPRAK